MRKHHPITWSTRGTAAVWVKEDVWQVGLAASGLTCERRGTRWYICASGQPLAGPYVTLAKALEDAAPSDGE